MNIKEIREATGMTQKEFAQRYAIPIGTIRRWEYGESTPAPYIIDLIASQLPLRKEHLKEIKTRNGIIYYYDKDTRSLMDKKGTRIKINHTLEDIKEQNLPLYVNDLFESYYETIKKFDQDCKLDKEEDILWS